MSKKYRIISYPTSKISNIIFSKNDLQKNIDKLLEEGANMICIIEEPINRYNTMSN